MAPPSSSRFPRLSRPVPLMRPMYDCVVIGSGYGGGVAASRSARGNKTVCVLELGQERWPGEYPTTSLSALRQLHVSGTETPHGGPTRMYNLVVGEGQNVFTARGLGGTSLVNANIFLEADDRTMALEKCWPPELRESRVLEKYYDRAREMLQPVPYPDDLPEPKKLGLLRTQAERMGVADNFYRPPQTTFFVDGVNSSGVEMKASTLSGQDSTGVNDGSKSSVLMNYLPDAWNWGAELFCECEVRYIRPAEEGGYLIFFAWHGNSGNRAKFSKLFHKELMWVRAKELCFIAAGTLGTTEILLRSRAMGGLDLSPRVGTGMSGNGDILSFGYNTDEVANAIGKEKGAPARDPVGTTITGIIDMRDSAKDVLDGFVLEEGAVPEALARVLQYMLDFSPGKVYPQDGKHAYRRRLRKFLARTETKIMGPYYRGGSLNRTQIYLIMSHDSNQATLTLEGDKPYLRFAGVGRSAHVKELNEFLAKVTHAVGGALVNSPFYDWFNKKQITVHPIGGANMSFSGTGEDGVTNHMGEVFVGSGEEVYPGLVCVDGSVVPCALGVNPFATITALAERSIDCLAEKYGWTIDLETKNGKLDLLNGKPRVNWPLTRDMEAAQEAMLEAAGGNGIRFAEVMDGNLWVGNEIEDFEIAESRAQGIGSTARFYLSVDAYSTKSLVTRSDHASMATGTFTCSTLSKDPFMVLRGGVQFFSKDSKTPDTENLVYEFDLIGTNGQILHFNGYKVIDAKMAFSPSATWRATTTLFVTITHPDASVVARGKLYVSVRNFVDEIKSFGSSGANAIGRFRGTKRFLSFFARHTIRYFFFPWTSSTSYPGVVKRSMTALGYDRKVQPTKVVMLTAQDDVQTTMHCWSLEHSNPELPPILFVPGAAVDHQIFALPTIQTNAVEYFLGKGYRVYVVTHRIGKTEIAKKGYTIYDARLDIHAAMDYVRRDSGQPQIYCIAHCAGSIAFSMGLLDGTIPAGWVKGLTASQVFFNPIFATINRKKADSPVPLPAVYKMFSGEWFDCVASSSDNIAQRLTDRLLRFYPVGDKEEMCDSVTCHRSELVFGRLWSHKQLNSATHDSLPGILGGISMNCLQKLMHAGTTETVYNNEGVSLINESNLARLEGVPILLVHGSRNAVFVPESTEISYATLQDSFGMKNYERYVIPGYGHLDSWMGKEAHRDVYPRVFEHIQDVMEEDAAGARR